MTSTPARSARTSGRSTPRGGKTIPDDRRRLHGERRRRASDRDTDTWTEDLVRFAQGTNHVARLHYDQDYARSRGFTTVIVHGALKATLMAQVLTNWVGLRGWVSDFRAEYRAPDPVGVTLTAHGIVRDVETAADGSTPTRVHVDLWVENQDGITTSTGRGTVIFDPLPLAVP